MEALIASRMNGYFPSCMDDNRISRTTMKLRAALLRLLEDGKIEDISVTKLCSEAGVGRNTFYAHYHSPSDVLEGIELELLDRMMETLSKVEAASMDLQHFVDSILRTVDANRGICTLILRQGRSRFITGIIDYLETPTLSAWIGAGMSPVEAEYTYHYCVSGALAVLEHWVMSGCFLPVEDVSQMMSRLIDSGSASPVKRYQ